MTVWVFTSAPTRDGSACNDSSVSPFSTGVTDISTTESSSVAFVSSARTGNATDIASSAANASLWTNLLGTITRKLLCGEIDIPLLPQGPVTRSGRERDVSPVDL